MATTTNYGWTTPDDTALVKDGASAIRSLGTAVDTTTKNLNPSTTLGDIEYRSSTANTNTRLGIGTSGQVLSVSGGVPAWTTLASGGLTLINTGGTALTGAASVSVSSIPNTYKNLYVYVVDMYPSDAGSNGAIRFNNNSSASAYSGAGLIQTTNTGDANAAGTGNNNADRIYCISQMANSDQNNFWYFEVPNYASTVHKKIITGNSVYTDSNTYNRILSGVWVSSPEAISSIQFITSASSWSGGTVYVYGGN